MFKATAIKNITKLFLSYHVAELKAQKELCTHYEKVASCVPCTYSTDGEQRFRQTWFQCYTCWGGVSNFGCCFPCALKCHKGHELIVESKSSSGFFCDCGKNNHQADVCIRYADSSSSNLMPSYSCSTCFNKKVACCFQCIKNCHKGHDVKFLGSHRTTCSCGSSGVSNAKCLIEKPKVTRFE